MDCGMKGRGPESQIRDALFRTSGKQREFRDVCPGRTLLAALIWSRAELLCLEILFWIRRRLMKSGVSCHSVLLNGTLSDRPAEDRKSTRLNSSHVAISYAVFCLKKKINVENS